MTFFNILNNNSVSSRLIVAFSMLTAVIIALEVFAYIHISQMLAMNALQESFSQLKEDQLHVKSAANEFILRDKTHDQFFESGKSNFLDEYSCHLQQLQRNIEEIRNTGLALHVVDEAELSVLAATLSEHRKVFLQMVSKIRLRGYNRYGLIGDFDKSIESLLCYDFGSDRLAVLNLQLFVKNYLLSGDENLIKNISNEIYQFTMMLEKHVKDKDVEKVSHILINYESVFKRLTEVDKELGIYTGEGLQKRLFSAIDNLDQAIQLKKTNAKIKAAHQSNLISLYASFFIMVAVAILAALVINGWLYRTIVTPIHQMKSIITHMGRGEVPESILAFKVKDLNEMAAALNNLVMGTRHYQEFANNIGSGKLNTTFTPLSDQDILGNALLSMQKSLKAHISRQQDQMQELQRLNTELDNFTYHASHDLRAPLTTILGLVNLGLADSSSVTSHTYFNMIKNRVDHMDRLLKDLISISYNNKMGIVNEEFSFHQEVATLIDALKDPENRFDIRLDIREFLPFASDPVRIRTILFNLLSNSFKYFNPEVTTPYISLDIIVDSRQASIVLKDNGIGIDSAHQEKIFNMFYRATTRSTGTGLGLFIVKSMIDRLNGKITIESVPNKGTNFFLSIPNLVNSAEKITQRHELCPPKRRHHVDADKVSIL